MEKPLESYCPKSKNHEHKFILVFTGGVIKPYAKDECWGEQCKYCKKTVRSGCTKKEILTGDIRRIFPDTLIKYITP